MLESAPIACVIRDEKVASYVRLTLEQFQYSFRIFTTATELVAEMAHWVPRVVITERHFDDDFHARHLCELIRTHYKIPYIYIILLSSSYVVEEIEAGLALGANDYMVEPFYPQQIHARLCVAFHWLAYLDQVLSISTSAEK